MTATEPQATNGTRPGEITSASVLCARVTWVFLGPIILGITVSAIISRGGGWTTFMDVVFLAVVVWMLFGRWFEQRSGAATTLDGEPATPAHFTRYVARLLPIAALMWIAANVLGNHVLG